MLNGLTPSEINFLYPVAGLTAFSHVLVLRRFSRSTFDQARKNGKKGALERLTTRSRHNFLLTVLRSRVKWQSLLTLTYGQNYPLNGRQVKSDWNAFITSFRRAFGPVRYFWFLEFQQRGAPHLHVGLDIGPPHDADRTIMADIWSRIAEKYDFPYCPVRNVGSSLKGRRESSTRTAVRANHRRRKTWEAIRKEGGAAHYVCQYATKPYQKIVPEAYRDVGRFWAVSRNTPLEEGLTVGGNEDQVREILKELGRDFDNWDMLPRVIYF